MLSEDGLVVLLPGAEKIRQLFGLANELLIGASAIPRTLEHRFRQAEERVEGVTLDYVRRKPPSRCLYHPCVHRLGVHLDLDLLHGSPDCERIRG
jgi:hypothetical protein